jgi:hypothetical protein
VVKAKVKWRVAVQSNGRWFVTANYYDRRAGFAQFGPFTRKQAEHVGERLTVQFIRNFFHEARMLFEFGAPCWWPSYVPPEVKHHFVCLCNADRRNTPYFDAFGQNLMCEVYHPVPRRG